MTNANRKYALTLKTLAAAVVIAGSLGGASAASASAMAGLNPSTGPAVAGGTVQNVGLKWCFPVQRCLSDNDGRRRPDVRDKRGRPHVVDKRNRPAKTGRCRVYDARTGRCRVMDYR